MKTIEHENLIQKFNGFIAPKVPKREGELDSPLQWDGERNIWAGFFANYDDGRSILLQQLRNSGFTEVFYEASYRWKMRSPEWADAAGTHSLEIEYIEGDLYATAI